MKLPKRLRLWSALLVLLIVVGTLVFWQLYKPKQRVYRLSVTAGSVVGTRHELAEVLRDELATRGVQLQIKGSVGSEEALDWVDSRQIDIAFVQGGLSVENRPNVRQIIALQVEPLHLLVKAELFEDVSKNLTALEGRTIDIGEVGSGTHTLATDVMEFTGLKIQGPTSPKGCKPVSKTRAEILAAQDVNDLPDALFVVSSLPARLVRFLVTHHGYRLVALPFGEAFSLQSLDRKEAAADEKEVRKRIDKRRTFSTTIPAFTYSVAPPVPAVAIPSLGNRLLVVAHKDVSPEAAMRLIEAVLNSEFGKIVQPPLSAKQMDLPPEFPWHSGSEKYIEHNQPIVSGEVMEQTQKMAAVIGAIISGLVVLWRWYVEYSRNKRSLAFRSYLNQVAEIEGQALACERGQTEDTFLLPKLHERLYQLKHEVLERFSEGELEGGEFMTTFLGQADHVSDLLTRLIQYRAAPR